VWRVVVAVATLAALAGGAVEIEPLVHRGVTEASASAREPAAVAQNPTDPSTPDPPLPTPPPPPPPRDFAALEALVQEDSQASGATVSVALIELAGQGAASWSYLGDVPYAAASTYKLPLLMAEAEGIANGTLAGSDQLCYQDADYEDGYYQDYVAGACYTRDELAWRAGQKSDNTAAHILVRYLGGGDAMNAYARAHGATESSYYDNNVTTANDLARLWVSEADGSAGGAAAQAWLYPLLENTAYEAGVPAGLAGATVAHKVGMIDDVVNDAALVLSGPSVPYVLVVCTAGVGGTQAFGLIAKVSSQVGQVEATRGA